MKTFKQFQEGLLDFLPKGNYKDYDPLTDKKNRKYKMPIIQDKPPKGGYRMPMPPQPTTKPDPYKTTLA